MPATEQSELVADYNRLGYAGIGALISKFEEMEYDTRVQFFEKMIATVGLEAYPPDPIDFFASSYILMKNKTGAFQALSRLNQICLETLRPT